MWLIRSSVVVKTSLLTSFLYLTHLDPQTHTHWRVDFYIYDDKSYSKACIGKENYCLKIVAIGHIATEKLQY